MSNTNQVYPDAPKILNWEDSICKHPKVMFNMCHVCKEAFEDYNRESHERYLRSIGMTNEQVEKCLAKKDSE